MIFIKQKYRKTIKISTRDGFFDQRREIEWLTQTIKGHQM